MAEKWLKQTWSNIFLPCDIGVVMILAAAQHQSSGDVAKNAIRRRLLLSSKSNYLLKVAQIPGPFSSKWLRFLAAHL